MDYTKTDLYLEEQHKVNLHLWVYKDDKFVSSYWTKNSANEDWIKQGLNDWFGITGWTHYHKQGETK